ncbi:hypothetical protein [Aestuariivivens sp. NBU2969]|uniref:hypothetical protein n=1 Tax=Aestuariivivens sp. NBU2969 TaxID=2873267 RepID=UPI001CBEFEED|nr:hypothetical protein [Aestuariivivens sp. NBU2969]
MEGLDLLKKDWNRQQPEDKKLSVKDIYPMLHKKSSSIVKTLFYISVGELILWIIINSIPYLFSENYKAKLDHIYKSDYLLTSLTIFSYAVIVLFIYLLFKSHKAISVTDNAKTLMERILHTRKIIKYYVLYNLIMAGVSLALGFYYSLTKDPKFTNAINNYSNNEFIFLIAKIIGVVIIFILSIWLFYKLIYGLLLKRLNRNYKELKTLEP